MKIAVVGLGLIGGSLCKTIKKRTTHACFGMDTDKKTLSDALSQCAIDGIATPETLCEFDLVFVCLHPKATRDFILEHKKRFQKSGIVCDVCGVKREIVYRVSAPLREEGVFFIGTHPMAGREFSGFSYSTDTLFDGASFIMTPQDDGTPPDKVETVRRLALELGFGLVVTTTPEEHDQIIAYTSQLAHVVSSAYIKSPTLQKKRGFTAGSFQDMTRVARLNEDMWTALFLYNREPLLLEIDAILKNLSAYRDALENQDAANLRALLKEGRLKKEQAL